MRSTPPSSTLFGNVSLPPGFVYQAAFLGPGEAGELLALVERLEFSTVVMRGVAARRRTAHFGVTYTYDTRAGQPGRDIPSFLLGVRKRLGVWAAIEPAEFEEALVTQYAPGAGIGWHRDAPMFGDVVAGISLGSAALMRFRPYMSPAAAASAATVRRTTHEALLEPGSAYLLTGEARCGYEHSIPPVEGLRYSITFRTLRTGRRVTDPRAARARTR